MAKLWMAMRVEIVTTIVILRLMTRTKLATLTTTVIAVMGMITKMAMMVLTMMLMMLTVTMRLVYAMAHLLPRPIVIATLWACPIELAEALYARHLAPSAKSARLVRGGPERACGSTRRS